MPHSIRICESGGLWSGRSHQRTSLLGTQQRQSQRLQNGNKCGGGMQTICIWFWVGIYSLHSVGNGVVFFPSFPDSSVDVTCTSAGLSEISCPRRKSWRPWWGRAMECLSRGSRTQRRLRSPNRRSPFTQLPTDRSRGALTFASTQKVWASLSWSMTWRTSNRFPFRGCTIASTSGSSFLRRGPIKGLNGFRNRLKDFSSGIFSYLVIILGQVFLFDGTKWLWWILVACRELFFFFCLSGNLVMKFAHNFTFYKYSFLKILFLEWKYLLA